MDWQLGCHIWVSLCVSALGRTPLFILSLFSSLCLCSWMLCRSLWWISPQWSPQMGADARRSHLRHDHLGYWNASDSCLLPGSQRCVCAPRVATAFFLSSCMGPARACSVQSSRGATYPTFHSPTPTALNVLSKHMAKRPTVCVAVLPSVPQDIVR